MDNCFNFLPRLHVGGRRGIRVGCEGIQVGGDNGIRIDLAGIHIGGLAGGHIGPGGLQVGGAGGFQLGFDGLRAGGRDGIDVGFESAQAVCSSAVALPDASCRTAASAETCFLHGTLFLDAELRPICVEDLRLGDSLRAATGEIVSVVKVVAHEGPHDVVTLQVGDASLRMTASHRVVVQRGGQHVPAPASSLRAGDDIVSRLGIRRLATAPILTNEDVIAFEIVFNPNLPVETFDSNNAILTMGSRPPRHRRGRRAGWDSDRVSIPPTDDGFED